VTAILMQFLAAAWKPILAALALFGLYAKGRADAKAKADLRATKAANETFERTANAPVHTDLAAAAERMRNRDPNKP